MLEARARDSDNRNTSNVVTLLADSLARRGKLAPREAFALHLLRWAAAMLVKPCRILPHWHDEVHVDFRAYQFEGPEPSDALLQEQLELEASREVQL
jgi:hypothetical protein